MFPQQQFPPSTKNTNPDDMNIFPSGRLNCIAPPAFSGVTPLSSPTSLSSTPSDSSSPPPSLARSNSSCCDRDEALDLDGFAECCFSCSKFDANTAPIDFVLCFAPATGPDLALVDNHTGESYMRYDFPRRFFGPTKALREFMRPGLMVKGLAFASSAICQQHARGACVQGEMCNCLHVCRKVWGTAGLASAAALPPPVRVSWGASVSPWGQNKEVKAIVLAEPTNPTPQPEKAEPAERAASQAAEAPPCSKSPRDGAVADNHKRPHTQNTSSPKLVPFVVPSQEPVVGVWPPLKAQKPKKPSPAAQTTTPRAPTNIAAPSTRTTTQQRVVASTPQPQVPSSPRLFPSQPGSQTPQLAKCTTATAFAPAKSSKELLEALASEDIAEIAAQFYLQLGEAIDKCQADTRMKQTPQQSAQQQPVQQPKQQPAIRPVIPRIEKLAQKQQPATQRPVQQQLPMQWQSPVEQQPIRQHPMLPHPTAHQQPVQLPAFNFMVGGDSKLVAHSTSWFPAPRCANGATCGPAAFPYTGPHAPRTPRTAFMPHLAPSPSGVPSPRPTPYGARVGAPRMPQHGANFSNNPNENAFNTFYDAKHSHDEKFNNCVTSKNVAPPSIPTPTTPKSIADAVACCATATTPASGRPNSLPTQTPATPSGCDIAFAALQKFQQAHSNAPLLPFPS